MHGPSVLGEFVNWIDNYLAQVNLAGQHSRIERLFHTALHYEYRFWEAAYHGETWPDES